MVPEGWSHKNLDELAVVERGRFSPRPRNDPRYYGGKIPFVQTGDVTAAKTYLNDYSQTLNDDGVKVSKVFPKGSILITIAANIGETAITTFDVACPDSVVGIVPREGKANAVWLNMALETKKEELDGKSTKNAQKNINLQVLKPLLFLAPPLQEQNKIAQIISAWDKAITTTEKLLTNSQQQKIALMQQLLTGKKRLLDKNGVRFGGEWKEQALGEIAEIIVSPVDKLSNPDEIPVELCNYTDVYYNNKITRKLSFMRATATQSEIDRFSLKVGDVIITKDSETPGDIAVPALVSEDLGGVVCGYHLAIIRPKPKKLDGAFLNQLLSMQKTRYYFFTLATGATRFGLPVGGIAKALITAPSVDEQRSISDALSVSDAEISALQERLGSLKEEKKALMQQLLTGKRRVKAEEIT